MRVSTLSFACLLLALFGEATAAQSTPPLAAAAPVVERVGVARGEDGAIVGERIYRLLPFDSLSDGLRRELGWSSTRADYERVRRDARFALRKIEYASDGLRVIAYVYQPAGPGVRRLPVIVFNKGSYVTGDQAPVLAPMMHRLAHAGFLVIAPQYRGSDGEEGHDEMGGADVHDVLNAVRLATRLPAADSTRVYMYGESRGGMMTLQALRDGVHVLAAATVGAFTDLDSLLAADPRARGAAAAIWPEFERDHSTIAQRRSAVAWSGSLRLPLLILHGGADPQVSPRHSLRLALQLDDAKQPYELHVLSGGSHTLGERAALRDSLVIAWFRTHSR